MFATTLKLTALAGILTFGGLAAAPAQAGDFSVTVTIGERPVYGQPVHYRRGYARRHGHYRPRHRRGCRPGRALRKARRFGVRHAWIHAIGPRGTIVHGRRHGRPVKVGIGHARGCPIVYANRRYH